MISAADCAGPAAMCHDPLLAAAASGIPTTIQLTMGRIAFVDAERLRTALAALCPSPVEVSREGDHWSAAVRGLPIAVEGANIDAVVDEVIAALRAQAPSHKDGFRYVPEHYGEWVLSQLIHLSDDAQLREWSIGGACVHIR
jgi:hypothetical protein